jgi:general stress protein YciG
MADEQTRGGDHEQHVKAGQAGGTATAQKHPDQMSEMGKKGGEQSGGNFKKDPERASEAGKKGGQS